jgi:hypothetical protein
VVLEAAGALSAEDLALFETVRAAFKDRYDVERPLGSPGRATRVFVARDQLRAVEVALKVLHPALVSTSSARRFAREVDITLSLRHPNILRLYESGSKVDDGGREYVYLCTPFVHGETLEGRLKREKQLAVADAVRITAALADALQYAHEKQVLHRDVKPSNVFLASDGSVLLADFGIARAMQFDADQSTLTAEGTIVGTPTYMSPEQITGAANVDGRADQYALASVAYEMLVGTPPFPGGIEVIWRRMQDAPPRIRPARPSVPEHVEAAILKALEKIPADRFASVAEFAEALRRERPGTRTPIWGPLPGAVDDKSCFVIMPFGADANVQEVYRDVVIPVAESLGLRVTRADDIFGHREIIRDIWRAIGAARVVIADVTGRNANVFYELGMAHAIGKDAIMLAQRREDVPFDVTHLRYILYEYTPRGVKKLEESLRRTLAAALAP